ncbi:hypothetical protein AgCh_027766 [Apium graveolens]
MINSGEGGADNKRWIVDSGASDHMTASLNNWLNVRKAPPNFSINPPTGATTVITHIGDIRLENGLKMMNVLQVLDFNHNFLSIYKLAKDNNYDIMFYPDECMIIDATSKMVDKRKEAIRSHLTAYQSNNSFLIGMIIRDNEASIVAGRTISLPALGLQLRSLNQIPMFIGVKEALSWLVMKQFDNVSVKIETDFLLTKHAINRQVLSKWGM